MSAPHVLDGAGAESQRVAQLWWWLFGAGVVVYVVVAAFVVVAVVRRGDERPESQGFVWLGGLVFPVLVLSVIAGATVGVTVGLRRTAAHEVRVAVTGHDWWWDVQYPDSGLRSANEVHLPVGRTAAITLRSDDVVHSFWVPQLAGKLDLIPGQTNVLRLTPRRTGTYIGECAEFCGLQHANMRFLVVVQAPDAYERWVRRQASPVLATDGAALFQQQACAGCHTIAGTEAAGRIGPDLTDFGRRRWIGGGVAPNTPDELLRWLRDPDAMKPGVVMPGFAFLSTDQLHALVTYLESLR